MILKQHITIAFYCLLLSYPIFNSNAQEQNDTSSISLIFMGDVMGHDSQIAAARIGTSNDYDYTNCFKYVASRIKAADIAFANLEVTLAGAPFKGYPRFSSPDALATGLQEAGVDVVVTANNHSCDRGRVGISRTIDVLDSINMMHTGTFKNIKNKQQNHPLLINKKGFIIALLNYTYGTNGLPVPKGQIVNLIDPNLIKRDIELAKKNNPDVIIAFMHWGTEYKTTPNSKQIELTKLLHNSGVDLVIGSHPHVLQPMHLQKSSNQLVLYSLGNFVSGQPQTPREGSAMVTIELEKTHTNTTIKKAEYDLTFVHKPIVNGKKEYYIIPVKDIETKNLAPLPPNNGWERLRLYAKTGREILSTNNNIAEKGVSSIQP